ncbi:MAG: HEPN domain-containing protein [Gemmataceae bacterium]
MKRITGQWLRKAEHDVLAGKHLFKLRPLLTDEICFHCQQAIEKLFKGMLAECGLPIQKTQLLPSYPVLRSLRPGLKGVTRCAVEYRYPGLSTTVRQARSAFKKTVFVRKEIHKQLGLRTGA